MKYQVIKDKDGYKVKYQIGDNRFDYVDTATTDCLGGCIKIWKSIKPAEKWINKNCLVGKPEIEYITDK